MERFLTCFVWFFINFMTSAKNNEQLYSTQIFMKETAAVAEITVFAVL
jgi:hypothetical protein